MALEAQDFLSIHEGRKDVINSSVNAARNVSLMPLKFLPPVTVDVVDVKVLFEVVVAVRNVRCENGVV